MAESRGCLPRGRRVYSRLRWLAVSEVHESVPRNRLSHAPWTGLHSGTGAQARPPLTALNDLCFPIASVRLNRPRPGFLVVGRDVRSQPRPRTHRSDSSDGRSPRAALDVLRTGDNPPDRAILPVRRPGRPTPDPSRNARGLLEVDDRRASLRRGAPDVARPRPAL